MKKGFITLPLTAAVLGAAAAPAFAVPVIQVDDNKVQCPNAAFTAIQPAVNAAAPGTQIQVCNGTYREQVDITKNVDLVSKETLGATISPPSGALAAPQALVHIHNTSLAKVRRFRIAGPGTGTADTLRHGVLVDDNATLTGGPVQVQLNLITNIRDITAAANEQGNGVQVGSFDSSTSTSHPGRATVLTNTITDYQKGGVVVNEAGSFATVFGNKITGLGLVANGGTPPPAQQGIQVAFDGAADVANNTVSDNRYGVDNNDPPNQYASFGILIYQTTTGTDPLLGKLKSRVKGNFVKNNDIGIEVYDAKNWLFETNRVNSNGDPSTAAADGGIDVGESAPGSGGSNRFNQNDARSNDGLDCNDTTTGGGTAGTGNTWTRNKGLDAFPAAICTPTGA